MLLQSKMHQDVQLRIRQKAHPRHIPSTFFDSRTPGIYFGTLFVINYEHIVDFETNFILSKIMRFYSQQQLFFQDFVLYFAKVPKSVDL